MPKRSRKKKSPDFNQLARKVVDRATGTTPAKAAKPPRPVSKKDAADIDRADSEGMGQPQGTPSKKKPAKKNPAAVALGRLGGLKGGPARKAKLSKTELSESARKAAQARWATKG